MTSRITFQENPTLHRALLEGRGSLLLLHPGTMVGDLVISRARLFSSCFFSSIT